MVLAFPRSSCPQGVTRRVIFGALSLVMAASGALAATPAPRKRIVTLLGDSITAGYGLPANAALPVQLEALLGGAAKGVRVRGAGVSGDTSADGLARVGFSVQNDTDVCVVALGGNDLLQGADTRRMHANLDKIVKNLKARNITVVLAGLKAPPVIGRSYARDFDAVFAAVAKDNHVLFLNDLLAGVAMDQRLNQRDGIHPNPAGVKVVAGHLAPLVVTALATRK
jgi:acyl-CoA thioesterase-1